jgi:hypothetical protein
MPAVAPAIIRVDFGSLDTPPPALLDPRKPETANAHAHRENLGISLKS